MENEALNNEKNKIKGVFSSQKSFDKNSLKFKNRYCFDVLVSNAGNGTDVPEYCYKINDNNEKVLYKKGVKSIYLKIQEHRDDTDIYKILDRYLKTGDIKLLDKNKGFFFDVSSLPDNIIDLNNKMLEQETIFHQLPIDVKNIYGNSLGKFSKAINDNTFLNDMKANNLYDKYFSVLDQKQADVNSINNTIINSENNNNGDEKNA